MKISSWKDLPRDKSGTIRFTAEDREDIYSLYTLISPGDLVETTTFRKVATNDASTSGNSDMAKIKMTLCLKVEKVDVDLQSASMRVNGRNTTESEWVKQGAYHTLDIAIDRPLKITKELGWDSVHRHILWQAGDPSNKNEIGAVLLDTDGVALLGMVTKDDGMRITKRIEVKQPKKKIGSQVGKAEERFFTEIEGAMRGTFDFARLKAVIIASPGDLKDSFWKKMYDRAVQTEDRKLIDNKSKFLRFTIQAAEQRHLHALLEDPRISSILTNTKTAQEQRLLDQLHKHINDDNSKGIYGLKHVTKANEYGAIKHLLLADALFRSCKVEERRVYGKLVDDVKSNGGSIQIFTPATDTEDALNKLTGVAAILNFPVEGE